MPRSCLIHQSEGGSPERLIASLGVESGLAGRIFVLLFAGPCPCFNNKVRPGPGGRLPPRKGMHFGDYSWIPQREKSNGGRWLLARHGDSHGGGWVLAKHGDSHGGGWLLTKHGDSQWQLVGAG